MSQTELVAMLRSRARKSGTQTSHFRGVSLLKQTGKWHAQINVGGKQVGTPRAFIMPSACAPLPCNCLQPPHMLHAAGSKKAAVV
jgi:hypothetical protein